MNSIGELSQVLRSAHAGQGATQAELKNAAGVSQRTLTNVLSGKEDFKVSTLLALADRLNLELLLVPKAAVPAIDAGKTSEPVSRVARCCRVAQSAQRRGVT